MTELRELLGRAAGDQPAGFDHHDIRARVERRRRRQRLLPAAVLVAVAAVGALAWWALDTDDRGAIVTGSSDPGVDELTADRWVAFALGTVTSVEGSPWIELDPDGTLVGYDGCAPFTADWSLTDAELRTSSEVVPSPPGSLPLDTVCEGPGTGLRELLGSGAIVGRPPGVDDQLVLRPARSATDAADSAPGITFRRFDRLGDVPSRDDLLGTWTGFGGDLSVTYDTDGTARTTGPGCEATSTWDLDGDVLTQSEPRGPNCVLLVLGVPSSRLRLATDPGGGRTLYGSNDDGIVIYDRVDG